MTDQAHKILHFVAKKEGLEEIFFDLPKATNVSSSMKKWTEAAGLNKKITFHSARHTFAMFAISADIDIFTVSKLLGHSKIDTTQIYAKLSNKEKLTALQKMPNIDFS